MSQNFVKQYIRIVYLSLFFIPLCYGCWQESPSKDASTSLGKSVVDTSVFAIFQPGIGNMGYANNTDPIELNDSDLQKVDSVIEQCIDEYNNEQKIQFDSISKSTPDNALKFSDFHIDPSKYKKQLLPYKNTAGHRMVWVNALCYVKGEQWKKEIIGVKDGGKCFFNLTINLTTGTFHYFSVNGDA